MYINGILQTGNKTNTEKCLEIINNMNKSADKSTLTSIANGNVLFSFSKDNSASCFSSEELGISVYISGNIYNCDEIKTKLSSQSSAIYGSASIAQIIAHGFSVYGKDIIKMLSGEFIIAIADFRKNSLLLARDRIGTHPLYYCKHKDCFLFSSSLKSIVHSGLIEKELDENAMSQFLQLTYIPAPRTIVKNVSKMLPATILEISDSKDAVSHCYWDVSLTPTNTDYDKCKKQLHDTLTESVQKRMNLKGTAGAFLSGGFDSTIIVGLMSELSEENINTFTIGYNEKNFIDETPLSKIVSDRNSTNHHTLVLDWSVADAAVSRILNELEEPFADSSLIATYMVCKETSQHCDYALTGDAGDELFAGYNKYLINYYNQRIKRIPKFIRNKIIKPVSKLFPYKTGIPRSVNKVLSVCDMDIYEQRKNLMMLGFKTNEMSQLLKGSDIDNLDFIKELYDKFPDSDEQTRTQYVDLKVVIDGCMLPKVRIAASLAGFKTIAPMLDSDVVELAFSMPSEFKIKKKERKIILKDAFRYLIPQELFKAPKNGFGVPIQNWLRYNLKERLYEVSEKEFIEKQGLFNCEYIQTIIDNHISGKEDRFSELWAFLVFQSWYKNFISDNY